MLRILVFAVGLLLFSLQVSAQDYHAYHAWIREIEQDLLDCKWDSASRFSLQVIGNTVKWEK
jgi:hypothetical protein